MSLPDHCEGVVLERYTDEGLKNREFGLPHTVAELLIRVPAEQRQNVLIEAFKRAYTDEWRANPDRPVIPTDSQIEAVIVENGW